MTESTKPTEQTRKVAVIIGRMSPPHVGHYAVINKVKQFIREHEDLELDPVPVVVVVDGKKTGKDKLRNPLSADDRVMFMKGSGRANGVRFLTAASAIDAFYAVRRAGYEPIAIAAGADRGNQYMEMLDKYFKTKDGKTIDHYEIKLPRDKSASEEGQAKQDSMDAVLQYVDKDMPVHMISGSLARNAVQKDEREKFAILVGLDKKPKLAELMFNKIKAAMEQGAADSEQT
jgi:hypothetical protein